MTQTVTASPTPAKTTSTPPRPPTSTAPKLVTKLPGDCGLLDQYDVQQAAGVAIPGATAFVVGVPEKDIGRIGYINCRYGLPTPPTGATPKIEIGVSLYDSVAQAQTRYTGTIADYVDHGASQQPTTVSGHPAVILIGANAPGYTIPLLVVAADQRTVAVSIGPGLVASAKLPSALAKVAALALQRTAS